jgi:hypothetical protein
MARALDASVLGLFAWNPTLVRAAFDQPDTKDVKLKAPGDPLWGFELAHRKADYDAERAPDKTAR